MDTLASYKRNSFSFSEIEKHILKEMLNYFKYEIPNGEGSYLMMINLDEIDFKWSPKMLLTDCGVFGTWSWSDKNSVYIRPSSINGELCEKIKSGKIAFSTEEEKENAKDLPDFREKIVALKNYESIGFDVDKIDFIEHMIENDGTILATIFHELYHKFQYNASPLLYMLNSGFTRLLGYEMSTKISWSIEGDVRKYIDNEHLWNSIKKFGSIFIKLIRETRTKLSLEKNYSDVLELDSEDPKILLIKEKYKAAKENIDAIINDDSIAGHAKFALRLIDLCHLSA